MLLLLLGFVALIESRQFTHNTHEGNQTFESFEHYWSEIWGGGAANDTEIRPMTTVMKLIEEHRIVCKIEGSCPTVLPSIIGARTNCVNGFAGEYPCQNVDLLAFVSLADLGSSSTADGNDIWGYQNEAGEMFALTGQTDGMSIVDITDPVNPIVLVWVQSQRTQNTIWRDFKVYHNYVYIVADGSGHGLQYLNLDTVIAAARLLPPGALPDRILRGSVPRNTAISNCHNIAINTQSGYAYAVGSSGASGGLYMYNLDDPANPTPNGQYSSDGYTHDVECVTWNEDPYIGHDICFGYNENSVTIVDVENRNSPVQLSRTTYVNSAYTHQGWITPNHKYIFMNDELDEQRFGFTTRTRVFDVEDLTNPLDMGYITTDLAAIDHNLYIEGNTLYESNYRSGLRIFNLGPFIASSTPNLNQIEEVAWFDTYPANDAASFDGAWSSYPYFEQEGLVIVQDINRGLFVLQYNEE